MDNRDFLENLLDFYGIVAPYGIARLKPGEDGKLVEICTATWNKKEREETRKILKYNLGFKIGICSWIGNRLCQENSEKIRKILNPRNDMLLLNVRFKGNNRLVISTRDVYGNVIEEYKIKILSINLFPDKTLGKRKETTDEIPKKR